MVTSSPLRGNQLTFATPANAANDTSAPVVVSPDADAVAGQQTSGVGLKAAVEARGGQSIYDKDAILKELELQNIFFEEKDVQMKSSLWISFKSKIL